MDTTNDLQKELFGNSLQSNKKEGVSGGKSKKTLMQQILHLNLQKMLSLPQL